MSRTACPYCGFQNFAISAYCGRCERPLPRSEAGGSGVVKSAPPPAPRADGAPPPPPPDATPAARADSTPPPRRDNTPPPRARPAGPTAAEVIAARGGVAALAPATRRSDLSFLAPDEPVRVPAPPPPLSLEAAPPTPIELDKKAKRKAERARGPNIGDDTGDPTGEVPVHPPSSLRLFIARLVDGVVVLSVPAAVVFLHRVITGDRFHPGGQGTIDIVAGWLNLHRELAMAAAILTALFGSAYSLWCNLRSGRTLGRWVTNTVLVRRSGKPFTWPILIVRGVAALLSAACFGAGFLWAIVDPYHRSFHDLIAGTVVVRRRVGTGPK